MTYKLQQSKIYWSSGYRSGAVFKLVCIAMPVVLLMVPVAVAAAILLDMQLLFLVVAILLVGLMPLLYMRLGLSTDSPDMTLEEWKKAGADTNVALTFSPMAVELMIAASDMAKKSNQPLSGKWVLGAFLTKESAVSLMVRLMIIVKLEDVKLSEIDKTSTIEQVLDEALKYAQIGGGQYVEVEDLFVGMAKCEPAFKQILTNLNLKEAAVTEVASWYKRWRSENAQEPFWRKPVVGGVGQDWAYGYTRLLSRFALNLTKVATATGSHVEIFSKTSVVDATERILARSGKNNVILVGEPGVGKKTIVESLARKIVDGKILPALRYKQVMQINVGAVLSGAQNQGEIVARIEGILSESAQAGNIVLYFDDFHALVSSKNEVGTVNAAEVFMPFLEGSRVQVVASTTIDRYHRDIERSVGIANLFERIDIPEASEEEAIKILEETIPYLEMRYKILYTYQSLKEIIDLGKRYVHDRPFPQKALDLADEVAVKVSAAQKAIVLPQDVQDIVSARTHVPVGDVQASEKEKLIKLEEILHKRVVGQDEAIVATSNALRRARSGLASKNRPIGTFLFVGPTGVGKTETAKALAEAYYGSEEKMIRLDMSEYQDAQSVYRLLGESANAGDNAASGLLTTAVRDNPFSLILLDELEKAHPNILTLFLQVFDDGRLTGNDGKTVDFTNAIIIATSNAGSEVIRQYLASGKSDMELLKQQLLDFLQKNGIYRPEFLNRFDAVIAFRPLKVEEMNQVVDLMMGVLGKQLAEKGISVQLSEGAKNYLVEKGYDPVYGARPMRRLIQDSVENVLARKMLTEDMKPGSVIMLDVGDLVAKKSVDAPDEQVQENAEIINNETAKVDQK